MCSEKNRIDDIGILNSSEYRFSSNKVGSFFPLSISER